jgi:hypothetical protein
LNPKYLHHFIAQVVDHLNRNPARLWLVKWPRCIAVQRLPRVFIDFGLQRCLQRPVGIVRAQKMRVPNEEAFLVVIGVDKLAGDAVRVIAPDLTRCRIEHIDPVNLQLNLPCAASRKFGGRTDDGARASSNTPESCSWQ